MSAFFIWDPFVDPADRTSLRFTLTNGLVPDAPASDDFVEAILEEMNIQAGVSHCVTRPVRSKYYSEYLDADEWQDVWPVVWRFHIHLMEPIHQPPPQAVPWRGTDSSGERYQQHPDSSAKVGCLVVADFEEEAQRESAVRQLLAESDVRKLAQSRGAAVPVPLLVTIGAVYQCQLELGDFPGEFFEEGADYAVSVEQFLKGLGGETHHQSRLP